MRASAFSFSQRLALDACTQCGQCLDVCPAVAAAGDAGLSAQMRLAGLKRLLRDQNGFWQNLLETFGAAPRVDAARLDEYGTSVFRCSLCGDCQEICPVGLPLKDLWLDVRRELAGTGHAPARIRAIRANLEGSHNVFDEDNDERADWLDNMRKAPRNLVRRQADIVYFTGCVGAYFPLAQKIPMALVQILVNAGSDFTIMGADEWCCGFPLLGSGQPDALAEIIAHNVAEVKRRKASTVVFTCPSCLQIWKEVYTREADLDDIRLVHASELVADLVRDKALTFEEQAEDSEPLLVTYHDPCDLGRGSRVFDEPRAILSALPGVKLVEMAHHGRHSLCCGGGGNLEMIDPALSTAMARRKVEEAQATGASTIVTTCQQCVRTMTTYVRRNKLGLEVLDLTQMVARALAKAPEKPKAPRPGDKPGDKPGAGA